MGDVLAWLSAARPGGRGTCDHGLMPARRLEWAIATGFACWAAARLAAADRHKLTDTPTASALSFTPHVTVAAWLATAVLSDPGAAAVSAAAAAALTSVVAPRTVRRGQPAATGPVLRVMTANLLVGRANPEILVDLVRGNDVDVLFVQELAAEAEEGLDRAGIGELLPHAVKDFGTADHRGGGIYSRYPLQDSPVPSAAWACPVVTLALPAAAVRLVCVHLHAPKPPWSKWRTGLWRHELRDLTRFAPSRHPHRESPPVLLAGDFNSTVDHGNFRRLLRSGFADAASETGKGLVPTWGNRPGSRRGLLTIDHVLVDHRCAARSVQVFRLPGSDHRALFAEVQLPA